MRTVKRNQLVLKIARAGTAAWILTVIASEWFSFPFFFALFSFESEVTLSLEMVRRRLFLKPSYSK